MEMELVVRPVRYVMDKDGQMRMKYDVFTGERCVGFMVEHTNSDLAGEKAITYAMIEKAPVEEKVQVKQ
ncbi:MAG: hypothetical protein NT130_05825 [Candidatus Micrarchaeota archaeon]|nr:hypothetical protein [Candidatus Micrarchaeota archaeon]